MAEARAGTPAQTPTSPWSYYPDPDFENSEAAQNPFLRCPYRNHWKADHQLAVRSQDRWEAGRRVLHHRLQPPAAAPGPAVPEGNLEHRQERPRAEPAGTPPAQAGTAAAPATPAKDLGGRSQTTEPQPERQKMLHNRRREHRKTVLHTANT